MTCVFRKLHHLGVLVRGQIHEIIVYRILRLILETHFVMEVRTGGLACGADITYEFSPFHILTAPDNNPA